MNKIAVAAIALLLSGCVTYDTKLHNVQTGQVMTCHESAPWGIMGLVAEHHHDDCVREAVKLGFTE